jgi:AcrR family transcriptional regulator
VRRDPPRRRRDELVAIAARLFASRGFANVTVDDIGAAAGISGPALYHHFDGKEALLGEMMVGISRRLLDGGRALADPMTPTTLAALVRFHCRFAVQDRELITIHFRDLIHAPPVDQQKVRRSQARYVALWVDALRTRHPGVDRRTAAAAVQATFGLMNSTPFSGRLPADRMEELLARLATASLDAVDGAVTAAADRPSTTARS